EEVVARGKFASGRGRGGSRAFCIFMGKIRGGGLQAAETSQQRIKDTRKRRGEVAESVFLAKAMSLGFGVAKPWGDSERYDFIVDSGEKLWRVQLKSGDGGGKEGGYKGHAFGDQSRVGFTAAGVGG